MTASEAIVARLLTLSAVTTLVSLRIRLVRLAQAETLPAILVTRVSETEAMHLRGAVGLKRTRIQVDSYANASSGADIYAGARAVDAAVYGDGAGSGLCGWSGSIGSPAVTVAAIVPISVQDLYDPDELRQVRVSRDYYVWHHS